MFIKIVLTSGARGQESVRVWILPSRSLYSTPGTLKFWICDFLTSCKHQLRISMIWRIALICAIPKPEEPKSYRPISLLCVAIKILERLNYARIEPIIDRLLPQEQAGFRQGRSTVDQVTLLTQDIEDRLLRRRPELSFSTLTAAFFEQVWGDLGKNLSHFQRFACSCTYVCQPTF